MNSAKRAPTVGALPRSLYLEATNRCDSKCVTCVRTFLTLEPPKVLTLAELKGIVDQFPVLERVVLHGIGEPLLNRDIFEIVSYLKAKGSYVLFNSDAISLNEKRAVKLIESGLDEFRVSMDSATQETYRKIRGVDQFDRVVNNVGRLREQQQKLCVQTPRVSLWFIATKSNLHELPGFVRLAQSIGVPEVYLQRLVTTTAGRFGLGLAVNEQAMHGSLEEKHQRLIAEAEELASGSGIAFKASGLNEPLESLQCTKDPERYWSGCNRPWSLSYVSANGNVFPCCIAPCTAKDYQGAILGNAFTEDFPSIWDGERYQQFRKTFEGDTSPDPCENCGLKWSH